MHMTKLKMTIAGYQEKIPLFVTKLGHYSIVLGLPWLQHHNVVSAFQRTQSRLTPITTCNIAAKMEMQHPSQVFPFLYRIRNQI